MAQTALLIPAFRRRGDFWFVRCYHDNTLDGWNKLSGNTELGRMDETGTTMEFDPERWFEKLGQRIGAFASKVWPSFSYDFPEEIPRFAVLPIHDTREWARGRYRTLAQAARRHGRSILQRARRSTGYAPCLATPRSCARLGSHGDVGWREPRPAFNLAFLRQTRLEIPRIQCPDTHLRSISADRNKRRMQ